MAIPGLGNPFYRPTPPPPPPPPPPPTPQPEPPAQTRPYRPEPTYNPNVPVPAGSGGATNGAGDPGSAPTGPSGVGGTEYGIPEGSTLSDVASGQNAQPFDVTLSQLATAVYGTRGGPPEGWSAVTDDQLRANGVDDPQAWRLTYLGANEEVQTNDQQFRAEVYTDGEGNYVLSYRGTAEGSADWNNNFNQATGFETHPNAAPGESTDKFSVTAAETAVEFASVFGNNEGGEPTNLAMTGHSQGGGLATVGSLASGVPAVNFNGSGVHPNTLERMGLDPQAARDIAEGGQIRSYSMSSDAVTRVQDSWITGLVAPDPLGTQIVVDPASADRNNLFTNYGPIENIPNSGLVNAGVELARNPITGALLGPVVGPLVYGVGNLAYAAISHSPNALTNAMIEQQPWQPGYENPSSLERDLQNLLPDTVKDDYARNTYDFVKDVNEVASTHFANGDFVQGVSSIVGDLGEGFFNSTGDTIDGYADQLAENVDRKLGGGIPGAVASTVIDRAGDVAEVGADVTGQAVETTADVAGWVGQRISDAGSWLLGR